MLFDGNPAYPDLSTLWRLAEDTRQRPYFGVSAAVPHGLPQGRPGARGRTCDLGALRGDRLDRRAAARRGLPLGLRARSAPTCCSASVSGGTDVCTAFVGGCPLRAGLRAGEIPCRAWAPRSRRSTRAAGRCVGEQGELVDHRADAVDAGRLLGRRRRRRGTGRPTSTPTPASGATATGSRSPTGGTCVITGRSDATLNRGGVRLGTAEFYAVVEALPEVADSLVVHLEDPDGGPGELLLFVVLDARARRSTTTFERLDRRALRAGLSPRHVPDAHPRRSRRSPARCRARSSRSRSSGSCWASRPTRPRRRTRSPTRAPLSRSKPWRRPEPRRLLAWPRADAIAPAGGRGDRPRYWTVEFVNVIESPRKKIPG